MPQKKVIVDGVLDKIDNVSNKLQTKLRKSKLKATIHKMQVERGHNN